MRIIHVTVVKVVPPSSFVSYILYLKNINRKNLVCVAAQREGNVFLSQKLALKFNLMNTKCMLFLALKQPSILSQHKMLYCQ
jgi:hypothetical protein